MKSIVFYTLSRDGETHSRKIFYRRNARKEKVFSLVSSGKDASESAYMLLVSQDEYENYDDDEGLCQFKNYGVRLVPIRWGEKF